MSPSGRQHLTDLVCQADAQAVLVQRLVKGDGDCLYCAVDLKPYSRDHGLITGATMNKIETITLHVGHVVEVEVDPTIEHVIQVARKIRSLGSTKVAAVRQIYPSIKTYPREAIWYAIMHGVNLSSRGAVTYYYKMKHENRRTTSRTM
jgi:hypothetical protein